MKRLAAFIAATIGAFGLIAFGYWIATQRLGVPSPKPSAVGHSAGEPTRRILYWYDPMLPDQHFDRPGRSPMGMPMVPKYADAARAADQIRINARTVENLGVRTAVVQRRPLPLTVRVPGTVGWDLDDAYTISARAAGIVTRLDARAPFTRVVAGQPVATLLTPEWGSAIAEYRALLRSQSKDAQALRAAARVRLRILGLTDQEVRDAEHDPRARASVTVRAPASGVLVTVEVHEGQRVTAGATMMTLNGLGRVWVEAAIPQVETAGIGAGTPVLVRVDAYPGRLFRGTVAELLPQVDPSTRAQRARIVLRNPHDLLAPGMFASVSLQSKPGLSLPLVPDDAVISAGTASRVIVADADGHFEPVAVTLGRSAGGYTEIVSGLRGGERIVVSGQFLIDSEASLSGALGRL